MGLLGALGEEIGWRGFLAPTFYRARGLAWAGIRLLVMRAPTNVPRLAELSVDWRVFAVTLVLSIATGIFFGLLPVAHLARRDLSGRLREGARGQSGSLEQRRGRALLVISLLTMANLPPKRPYLLRAMHQ